MPIPYNNSHLPYAPIPSKPSPPNSMGNSGDLRDRLSNQQQQLQRDPYDCYDRYIPQPSYKKPLKKREKSPIPRIFSDQQPIPSDSYTSYGKNTIYYNTKPQDQKKKRTISSSPSTYFDSP